MASQIDSSVPLSLNTRNTLSEASSDYSDLDVIGKRFSTDRVITLTRNSWNIIPLVTIDYGAQNSSSTVDESGFYNVGFTLTVSASEINDFKFEATIFVIRNGVETQLLQKNIRTIFINQKQIINASESINLNHKDKLILAIRYSKGSVILNHGALFYYKTDYEFNLHKKSGLEHFFKCDEISSAHNKLDSIGSEVLESFISTPSNNFTTKITNGTNDHLRTNSLKFTNRFSTFSSGFTLLMNFKIEALYDFRRKPGYVTLISRSIVNNKNVNGYLYKLYLDTWTLKFIFLYLDKDFVPRVLATSPYENIISPSNTFTNTLIVLSFDQKTNHLRLMVNDLLQESIKVNGLYQETNGDVVGPLFIGKSSEDYDYPYNSTFFLSDIALFNRELNAFEIEKIYRGSIPGHYGNNPDYILGLYEQDTSLSLPIEASSVIFNNSNNTVDTVQNVLTEALLQLRNISSSNVTSYNGSIIFTDWILDSSRSVYTKTLPYSIHGILAPWEVIVQVVYNGKYIVSESMCEIEIDAVNNDVSFYVNDVPDGRFVGRFIIIGY